MAETSPTPSKAGDLTVSERILERLREVVGVERVFGAPVERDGATVIPVATIRTGGGGGGGAGGDEHGSGSGEGSGFGATARPIGAYVIRGSDVSFKPALDYTRLYVIGNVTAVAYFFFAWLTARSRAKRR